jgi:hypothetical protein
MTVDEDRSVVVTFAGICRIGTAGTIHIVIYILIMILCLTYLESKGGDVVAMKVEEKLMQLPCPSQASGQSTLNPTSSAHLPPRFRCRTVILVCPLHAHFFAA